MHTHKVVIKVIFCVFTYLNIYPCFVCTQYTPSHVSNAACIKTKPLINFCTAIQTLAWKWHFFQLKTACGDSPQTSSWAYVETFSDILRMKNIKVGPSGSIEMGISFFQKWNIFMQTEAKNSLEALLWEFSLQKWLTLGDISVHNVPFIKQLFKYTFLAAHSN